MKGLSYLSKLNSEECFYYEEPQNDANTNKHPFEFDIKRPFLLVNIGSGISILHVDSQRNYRRITGTRLVEVMFVNCYYYFVFIIVLVVVHFWVYVVY
jgi:type II pantothenate kinase